MGVINGAKYVGINQIKIPGGNVITIRQAEKAGFWAEEERAIHKSGRPKGVKNFSGRALNAKDIKRIFGVINKATELAIYEGGYRGMFALGKELLSVVTNHRKFNSYTGNLMDAYQATIVTGGKPIKKIKYGEPKMANDTQCFKNQQNIQNSVRYEKIEKVKSGVRKYGESEDT